MEGAGRLPRPMRIEIATSEIEGGECRAWADPEQVVACVAAPRPADTFVRFLEPRLADLDRFPPEERTADPSWPPRLRALLDRLRQVHARLIHEPRSVRLALTVVDDDRVWFIKGMPCWVYRIRDGAAGLAGGEGDADGGDVPALGEPGRLRLVVTSIDVRPDDLVVLLAAAEGTPPDRRSVAQVFEQTQDLKRACDGLVNLLGMGSSGAGAVAIRFVPIGARPVAASSRNVIEEIERAVDGVLPSFGRAPEAESPAGQSGPAEPFRFPWEAETPAAPAPSPAVAETAPEPKSKPMPMPAPLAAPPPLPVPAPVPVSVPDPVAVSVPVPGPAPAVPTPAPPSPVVLLRERRDRPPEPESEPKARRLRPLAWIGLGLLLVLAVAAIPTVGRLVHRGPLGGDCVLRVETAPAARAIVVDGRDLGSGSPAILDGLRSGVHSVRLDFGPLGVVERKVRVNEDDPGELRCDASGSLEITSSESREDGRVWVEGWDPQVVPCRFDSLPVGLTEVYFEDEASTVRRTVLLRAGETARVRIRNSGVPADRAMVSAESWVWSAEEGLEESRADTLYLDGRRIGLLPRDVEVEPGLHGIRVQGPGGRTWTEVADLRAGSTRVLGPRFGIEERPTIRHQEPGRVLLRGPLLMTATIRSADGSPPVHPRIHLPGLGDAMRELPLTPVEPERGVYIGMLPARSVPLDRTILYYFSVEAEDGRTYRSDLYRFTAVSELSLHAG